MTLVSPSRPVCGAGPAVDPGRAEKTPDSGAAPWLPRPHPDGVCSVVGVVAGVGVVAAGIGADADM